jgi:hypothetical protein
MSIGLAEQYAGSSSGLPKWSGQGIAWKRERRAYCRSNYSPFHGLAVRPLIHGREGSSGTAIWIIPFETKEPVQRSRGIQRWGVMPVNVAAQNDGYAIRISELRYRKRGHQCQPAMMMVEYLVGLPNCIWLGWESVNGLSSRSISRSCAHRVMVHPVVPNTVGPKVPSSNGELADQHRSSHNSLI